MTYTWTVGKNTITINTETGTITGGTYPLRDIIKENFPGISWDKQSKAWTLDGAEMQKRIDEYNEYFTRVYHMDVISSTAKESQKQESSKQKSQNQESPKQEETIERTELVNGNDGFYQVVYYTSGLQRRKFIG